MLSPSDFNNAVPQFTNGDYASNPINPQYIAEPDAENYNRGTEPLQTLPAQWWNWFLNRFTNRFNKVNIYVKNIFNELAQLLSLVSETPSGTEGTPTVGQLKDMFETKYPDYLKTTPALSNTYVPQTTRVNGHELCENITITCVACASCNGSGTAFGTAATKNTGTAAGCIPIVGTALGTTNGQFIATDANGCLKPSGYTASCFRASDWNPQYICMDYFIGSADRPVIISTIEGTCCDWINATLGPAVTCKFTFNPATGILKIPGGGIADVTCTNCKTTFNFGAAGVNNPIWLAAWNQHELRATSRASLCVGCAGYACRAACADPLIYSSAICVCLCCIGGFGGTCQYNVYVCSRCSYPAKPMGGFGSNYGCCYAYILSTGAYFASGAFNCIGSVSGSNLHSYCMPGSLVKI